LENGDPKPTVVLIDFPQMVSTQHPNAKELYERDTACLFKFFSHKLQFQIPEADQGNLFLTWESVQEVMKQNKETPEAQAAPDNDTESVCLASREQLRLDQELKASGYSDADASRDMELYYFNSRTDTPQEAEEEDVDGQEDMDGQEDVDGQEDEGDDRDDGDSIESQEEEEATTQDNVCAILPPDQLKDLTRQQLREQAKLRVRLQPFAKAIATRVISKESGYLLTLKCSKTY
jgi:RIO kinase 2